MLKMRADEREVLPFFIIVAAVMLFLYGIALYSNPVLRQPPEIFFFSMMMGVHIVLHWFFHVFSRAKKRVLIYFCIQTALASLIIMYTKELSLVFGLYLALLGEEVGVFRKIKSIIFITAFNILLIAGIIFIQNKVEDSAILFFAGVVPVVIFVIIYVELYVRQSEAKDKARRLLMELEEANRQLSESNAQIEELTIEQERQRMARELHDTLAQGLSGLILQLEAAAAHMVNGNNTKASGIVEAAMNRARSTLAEARSVIDDLRTGEAEPVTLQAFIKKAVEDTGPRIRAKFKTDVASEPPVSAFIKTHLFKIIGEALNNCAEHSEAEKISVQLSESEKGLELIISDDGIGFEPESVPQGHYGLIGIKERCRIIGGSFTIQSNAGQGTDLIIQIPGEC